MEQKPNNSASKFMKLFEKAKATFSAFSFATTSSSGGSGSRTNNNIINKGSELPSYVKRRLELGGMRVLILGCGTGTWLLEMAEKYPESTFIGFDDSSDYPGDESSHLQNAGFKRGDFLCGIPFHNSTFDLVLDFVDRSKLSGFQNDNLFSEVVRVLKPDGFLKKMKEE